MLFKLHFKFKQNETKEGNDKRAKIAYLLVEWRKLRAVATTAGCEPKVCKCKI